MELRQGDALVHETRLSKEYVRAVVLESPTIGRRVAFWYALIWLVVLLALAYCWARGYLNSALAGIPLPAIASAWAGAVGAITISLRGVYEHWVDASKHPRGKSEWTNALLLWHIGRPVTGAVIGVVVFAVFQAAYPSGTPSAAPLVVGSFVLGLQERQFFEWVKQIGAALLAGPVK